MSGRAQSKRSFSFARARRKLKRALRPDLGRSRRSAREGALKRQKRIDRLGLSYFAGASRWLRRSSGGESNALERDGPAPTGEARDIAPRFSLQRAVQADLDVGEPNDPMELEADAVADSVGGGHESPGVSRMAPDSVQSAPAAGGRKMPARASTRETIERPGMGQPLGREMRDQIEPSVGADLGDVRVHTDERAQSAAADLNARAFASGPNIFLGRGESPGDQRLMAHEATHVVQQGAAVARTPSLQLEPRQVQRLLGVIMDRLASYARHIPGYTLFTVIIGFNPLTGSSVARNATNLLEGLMGLVPFGTAIFDKLQEHGILEDAFTWVRGQLDRLDLSINRIERTLEDAWDDYTLGTNPLPVLERHFGRLLRDVEEFAESLVDKIIEMIKEVAIGLAERLLEGNQAWALIKKVLHYDPLRGEDVEASTVEILEDFLILIGKESELEQMRARGTLQETADWLDTQIGTFTDLLSTLGGLFADAWEAIQPRNLPNLADNLSSLAERAFGFLQRVWDFAITVAAQVLQLIKDALLSWLKSFATDVPGYHLLTVILEKDPFTDEPVPRTPTNLIRGFMSLMPGGEQQFQEMQESGVIGEAARRIETAMTRLGITWEGVVGLFLGIWDSLSIDDLIDPIGAFQRIVDSFGGFIRRLFEFIVEVIKVVIELILKLMNFPSDILGRIISNAVQAIEDIKRDPVQFIKNLLQAVKSGFGKFFDNIVQHLLSGVTEWLFGNLRKAGIEPPSEITLESALDLVMQVLGITAERLWDKLAERIGQENVDRIRGAIDRLVGIWTFIKDVQERGVAAIWERIQEQISGLWDMVLEKARDWIVTRVIERVVTKLISMLDPTGIMAVVNSFIAFFNAVQSAIEYFREMLLIVDEYVTTVAQVARGNVEPGAVKLESALGRAIPVAIGFLANQVGLGNLAEKLQEILQSLQEFVDRGVNWLMDRAVSMGQSLLRTLGLGGSDEEGEEPTGPDGELSDTVVGDTVRFTGGGEGHRLYVSADVSQVELMVASDTPMSLGAKVDTWQTRLPSLGEQAPEARGLITTVRGQYNLAKQEGQEAKQAIDQAQQAPTEATAAEAERQDNEVEELERAMTPELGRLFDLFEGGVPYRTVERPIALHGGAEQLVVPAASSGQLSARVGDEEVSNLLRRMTNVFAGGLHAHGLTLVRSVSDGSLADMRAVGSARLTDGHLPSTALELLNTQATNIAQQLGRLGAPMRIPALSRIFVVEPTQSFLVEFGQGMGNKPALIAEYDRQLREQQAGLNRLTVDRWVVNRNAYSLDEERLERLDAEERESVLRELHSRAADAETRSASRRQRFERAAEELEAALADPGYEIDTSKLTIVTGRFGNERAWRRRNREGIRALLQQIRTEVTDWQDVFNRAAALHNADQIAGGFGEIPDVGAVPRPAEGESDEAWDAYLERLRAFVGSSRVNSGIGSLWARNIDGLESRIRGAHPPEGWPIWRMNVDLRRI